MFLVEGLHDICEEDPPKTHNASRIVGVHALQQPRIASTAWAQDTCQAMMTSFLLVEYSKDCWLLSVGQGSERTGEGLP